MGAGQGHGDGDYLSVVAQREAVLRALRDQRLDKPALVERLDVSRSTVDRAVRELAGAGLVEKDGGVYAATLPGRLAADQYETYARRMDSLGAAGDLLTLLPPDADLDVAAVAGAETHLAGEAAAYQLRERLADAVSAADAYRAVLPALPSTRHSRLLYEHVVTGGDPAELVVSPALDETLRAELPVRLPAMTATGAFDLAVGDVPGFGVVVTRSGEDVTAWVLAFGDGGDLVGLLENDADAAVQWAAAMVDDRRARADDATDEFRGDAGETDGGTAVAHPGAAPDEEGRLVALETEGFQRLSAEYFATRSVADPRTAWRAGLDLAEVQAGYAIERTREADGERRSLDDALLSALGDGGNCLLVGPPGAGKSTVCKRVACEWYREGGPVFYREQGAGRPFESVEALVGAARAADGHALVVVEDAVRAEANAVLDAVEAVGDDGDVSFLLDAREREWRDPPGERPDPEGAALTVESMPGLGAHDCERLVARFETTAGVSVDAAADELRDAVRSHAAGDETAPSAVLLLLHRLATFADPLADDATTLEAEVARVYDALASAGDLALDVAALANLVNAAGLGVHPGYLHAVDDDHGTVAAAIDRLDGRTLFERRADGDYRAVHETWSTAFLAHLADVEGDAAAERFARVASALLSLADDPDRRDCIADTVDDPVALERVAADPTAWADEAVEALFTLGRKRPKLAPLFCDERGPGVDLPAACSEGTRARSPLLLAEMFTAGGHYDRAERALERLPGPEADPDLAVERQLGRAKAAFERGSFERSAALAEASRELAADVGDDEALGRAENAIGKAARERGDYEGAREQFERSLDVWRRLGDRWWEAAALNNLGIVASYRGDYEGAREYFERSLAIGRDLGDRRWDGWALGNLGNVLMRLDEYEGAREHFERSLEVARELGDRSGAGATLINLGNLQRMRSSYDRARECLERGIELTRETDDRYDEQIALGNLGEVLLRRGDLDAAREHFERSLDIARDLDARHEQADEFQSLGVCALRAGDTETARERLERALEVASDIDNPRTIGAAHLYLGQVVAEEGDHAAAADHLDAAEETFEESGTERRLLQVRLARGRLALARGEADATRDRARAAADGFERIGIPHFVGRAHLLAARAAAAAGDDDAREHGRAALERFESVGAPQDALAVLELLVGTCREVGDDDAARAYVERAESVLADAPSIVVERHGDWVERERVGM